MNQSNFNQQNNHFNYDHFQSEPEPSMFERIVGPGLAAKFRNPIFATGALLLVGAAFAGVIVASYPDSDSAGSTIPVVQADASGFKVLPDERGGQDVPFQDSTVYSSLRNPNVTESAPVENLLTEEAPVDRLEAFANEAERIIEESEAKQQERLAAVNLFEEATGVETQDAAPVAAQEAAPAPAQVATAQRIQQEVERISPQQLIQKIETPEKPKTLHKPGSSPDTLEFVKGVLEQKDAKDEIAQVPTPKVKSAAERVAAIQPAAGHPVTAGTHYIQLGSVKSEAGAAGEWGKLQKKFPSVAGMDYRVQRADLGERGVFYRIQAGPISGESAKSICGGIKAQNPGACLVTK